MFNKAKSQDDYVLDMVVEVWTLRQAGDSFKTFGTYSEWYIFKKQFLQLYVSRASIYERIRRNWHDKKEPCLTAEIVAKVLFM